MPLARPTVSRWNFSRMGLKSGQISGSLDTFARAGALIFSTTITIRDLLLTAAAGAVEPADTMTGCCVAFKTGC
jgi:hypothetical protein